MQMISASPAMAGLDYQYQWHREWAHQCSAIIRPPAYIERQPRLSAVVLEEIRKLSAKPFQIGEDRFF